MSPGVLFQKRATFLQVTSHDRFPPSNPNSRLQQYLTLDPPLGIRVDNSTRQNRLTKKFPKLLTDHSPRCMAVFTGTYLAATTRNTLHYKDTSNTPCTKQKAACYYATLYVTSVNALLAGTQPTRIQ